MFLLEVVPPTDFWVEAWNVTLDPAHIFAELIFTIVFDGLVIAVLYNLVFKKFVLPIMKARLAKEIHQEIDAEHGYQHTVVKHSDNENHSKS